MVVYDVKLISRPDKQAFLGPDKQAFLGHDQLQQIQGLTDWVGKVAG